MNIILFITPKIAICIKIAYVKKRKLKLMYEMFKKGRICDGVTCPEECPENCCWNRWEGGKVYGEKRVKVNE